MVSSSRNAMVDNKHAEKKIDIRITGSNHVGKTHLAALIATALDQLGVANVKVLNDDDAVSSLSELYKKMRLAKSDFTLEWITVPVTIDETYGNSDHQKIISFKDGEASIMVMKASSVTEVLEGQLPSGLNPDVKLKPPYWAPMGEFDGEQPPGLSMDKIPDMVLSKNGPSPEYKTLLERNRAAPPTDLHGDVDYKVMPKLLSTEDRVNADALRITGAYATKLVGLLQQALPLLGKVTTEYVNEETCSSAQELIGAINASVPASRVEMPAHMVELTEDQLKMNQLRLLLLDSLKMFEEMGSAEAANTMTKLINQISK